MELISYIMIKKRLESFDTAIVPNPNTTYIKIKIHVDRINGFIKLCMDHSSLQLNSLNINPAILVSF